jgi:hypothetical protein
MRGTSNTDTRGSSYDRRRRRDWLMLTFGNGKTIPCFWCKKKMRTRFEVDRFPVCGHDGGRYVRENIVASCAGCNNNNRCTTAKKCKHGSGHKALS